MIPVKVCGITNLEDALICVSYGVSALGFIFAPSKRQVDPEKVYQISRQLSPFIVKVGVFVDEDPHRIKEILKDCRLDLAQLHGKEVPDDCELLEGRAIKAFRAGYDHPDPIWKGAALRGILIDSYSAEVAGGTGTAFDWKLAADYRQLGFPLILAGGLNPDNIETAVRAVRPDGVDLSSGVERGPGVKDPEKIAKLMERIRRI
ncbi:MAG: phosphoribosylanthranilate isomerase [Bacteroidota bacterium]